MKNGENKKKFCFVGTTLFLSLLLLWPALNIQSQQWNYLGNGYGNNPFSEDVSRLHFTTAPDGTPYLSYKPTASSSNHFIVRRKLAGTWEDVGSPVTFNSSWYLGDNAGSVVVGNDGTPYLIINGSEYGEYFLDIFRFTNGSWESIQSNIANLINNPGNFFNPRDVALEVDGNDVLHLAVWNEYYDAEYNELLLFAFNGSTWSAIGDNANQVLYSETNHIVLGFDGNNVPHIAYKTYESGHVIYVKAWNGTSWAQKGSTLTAYWNQEFMMSLKFYSNNDPVISYCFYDSNSGETYLPVKQLLFGSWLDLSNNANIYSSSGFEYAAFEIYNNELYQFTFLGSDPVFYKRVGSTWTPINVDDLATGSTNKFHGIGIGADGMANICYMLYNDGHLYQETANGFVDATIDGFAPGDLQTLKVAAASDGSVFAAFQDIDVNYNLTVMQYANNVWETVGSRGISQGIITEPQIALDDNDIPYVMFKDQTVSGALTCMRYFNNTWELVGAAGFSLEQPESPDFLMANNIPTVVYGNGWGQPYKLWQFDGSTWNQITLSLPVDAEYPLGIASDAIGNLYISYSIGDDEWVYLHYFQFYDVNTGTWSDLPQDDSWPVEYERSLLEVGQDGYLYHLYVEGGEEWDIFRLNMRRYVAGIGWEQVGLPNFSEESPYSGYSFMLNSANVPYVMFGYYNSDNSSDVYTIRYWDGNAWAAPDPGMETLPMDNIQSTDLFVSNDGNVYTGIVAGPWPGPYSAYVMSFEAPAQVMVWQGTVDNNWENPDNWSLARLPALGEHVDIPLSAPFAPHIYNGSSIETGNIALETGAELFVEAGGALTLTGDYSGGGTIVLLSDNIAEASLLHTAADVPGRTVLTAGSSNVEWHMLSSPVANQSISPVFSDGGFFAWHEPSQGFAGFGQDEGYPDWAVANNASNNFIGGKGYFVSYSDAVQSRNFEGSLHTGELSIALSKASPADEDYHGINLVGNPYPSSLDWKSTTGWDRSGLKEADQGSANYAYWLWNGGSGNYGTFISDGANASGTNGVSRYIAPKQGFWVVAAVHGALLTMNNDARAHSGQAWLKADKVAPELLKFRLSTDANSYSDELVLDFSGKEGTAIKLFSLVATAPEIFAERNSVAGSILRYGTIPMEPVKIGIKTGVSAHYTLTVSYTGLEQQAIWLEDVYSGTFIDLKKSDLYSFESEVVRDNERFKLHFNPVGLNENSATANKVFYSDGRITVLSQNEDARAVVEVFNMQGIKLAAYNRLNAGHNQYVFEAANGVYLVRIRSLVMTTHKFLVVD